MIISRRLTLAMLIPWIALACHSGRGGMQEPNENTTMDADTLGRKLGLTLPPGTEVLGVEAESGVDDAIRAKLRIPTPEAKGFLEGCGVRRFKPGGANLLGPDHGFWNPHTAKALRFGEISLPSSRSLLVVIDESSKDALLVFAMNYST